MRARLQAAFHPQPKLGRVDTSLRYTDILFGFVIRELFLRLQNWPDVDVSVRWHLVAGTVLVLGSWIGFRRSLNRTSWEVMFFNLPFFRFLVDQLMLILYFRIAVLTKVDLTSLPDAATLATTTIRLLAYVFVLYVVWDALNIWMAGAGRTLANGARVPRYPKTQGERVLEGQWATADWAGLTISAVWLAAFVALWLTGDCLGSTRTLIMAAVVLVAYRFAKEIRTSWRELPRS